MRIQVECTCASGFRKEEPSWRPLRETIATSPQQHHPFLDTFVNERRMDPRERAMIGEGELWKPAEAERTSRGGRT